MASSSSPDFLCSSALAVTLASELAAAVCVSCSTWRMASAICRIQGEDIRLERDLIDHPDDP